MKNFERIEAYLEGWMSIEDRAAFEAELQYNEALKKDYQDWLHADHILKKHFSVDEEKEQLESILQPLTDKHFSEEEPSSGRVVPFKKYLFAAVAAAAILVVYISLPGIEDYSVPEMPTATVRGAEELRNQPALLFNDGAYETALPLLEKQAQENPEDASINFFYGVALVKTEQFEKAFPILKSVANGTSVYKTDASFFTALIAYKLDDKKEALLYAQQVNKQSQYYKKAQKIIKKLH